MKIRTYLLPGAVWVFALSLLLSGAARGAVRKISGELPEHGSVRIFQVSPDGLYTVYVQEQGDEAAAVLYSVPVLGGEPQQLSGDAPDDGEVVEFIISPDSRFVIYLTDSGAEKKLFSVPLPGPASAAVLLVEDIGEEQSILSYQASQDGEWVVMRADLDEPARYELYSIPTAGPKQALRKLSVPQPKPGRSIVEFVITPDSSRVVYKSDGYWYSTFGQGLYSVPIEGPAESSTVLHPETGPSGAVGQFAITSDSQRVLYLFGESEEYELVLYNVPVAGPAAEAVEISLPIEQINDGRDSVYSFQITPDDQKAVYIFRKITAENWSTFDLYSVPLSGPGQSSTRLSPPAKVKTGVTSFAISPDSQQVIFAFNPLNYGVLPDLYRVPASGPADLVEKINFVSYPDGWIYPYQISPDSSYLAFHAVRGEYTSEGAWEAPTLFGLPLAGSLTDPVRLTPPLPEGGAILDFQFTANGSRLIYLADQEQRGRFELYSIPPAGPQSAAVKLNTPLPEGGRVKGFALLPTYNWSVYLADQESAGLDELFLADEGEVRASFASPEVWATIFDDQVELRVLLSQPSIFPVSIDLLASDSSIAPLKVTFAPGQTEQTALLDLSGVNGQVVITLEAEPGVGMGQYPALTIRVEGGWIYLPLISQAASQ